MKLQTNKVLHTITGEAYQSNNKDLILGFAIAQILTNGKSADPLKAFVLAQKFITDEEVEVSAEDIVFIKERAKESTYFDGVIGQVFQALEV